MRVVSLLPSATETLAALLQFPLQQPFSDLPPVRLVGRSHECDHPASVTRLPALTSQTTDYPSQGASATDALVSASLSANKPLYHLDADRLRALEPDLILTQDLCSVCSIDLDSVRAIADSLDPPARVLSFNPATIEAVFDDILTLGRALAREDSAKRFVGDLRNRFFLATDLAVPYAPSPTVAFLDWPDPLYIAGHWTPALIERAGGSHPLNPTSAHAQTNTTSASAPPSRRITPEELLSAAPDRLILCPCGLNLDQTRAEAARLLSHDWFRSLPAVKNQHVALVDGNQMFNRPSHRLVDAFEWLAAWINDRPDRMPADFPWEPLERTG
ncbi:MAG: ABC transporter substrate-binding protein [Phycisphaerales bacterium]